MPNYDIAYLGRKAEELGFVRDTLEKVTRLVDILEYLNTNPILKESLAIKGGTAINLTIFNLPRLSVDIDLDYLITNSREDMLKNRGIINNMIHRYMISQGYSYNLKSKNHHSLDSWVYDYLGVSGNIDNIKVEINYSLRSHIFEAIEKSIVSVLLFNEYKVKMLNPIEIYGSKINALLNRAAPRDLYDTRNMIVLNLFNESEKEILRKCVIFYAVISAKDKNSINKSFNTDTIDRISNQMIKRELRPVINRSDDFNLEESKELVIKFIMNLMVLTKDEKLFLIKFESGEYKPELLFEDSEVIKRINHHPMAVWKLR